MRLRSVRHFLQEARRRRVYVSLVAYVAVGAGVIQVIGPITDALLLPGWTPRLVTFLLILGLPVVLVLAWIFDITSEGVKRTGAPGPPGKRAPDGVPSLHPEEPLPELPVRSRKARATPRPPTSEAPPDPLRVKRVALGHVRHELRTPINGILGYVEMVLEEVDDPSIVADLGRIREAGRRLLALVDEILNPDAPGPAEKRDLDSLGEQIRADLRTPANAVIGYAEMVMEAATEGGREDLVPELERIRAAARRLLGLSEDIVKMAALRAGEDGGLEGSLGESSELARGVLAKIQPLDAPGAARGAQGEGRVLVVDDNAMNRDLLCRGLARAGYMVAEAEDGERALALLDAQDFDVILLDVIMPGIDGVETLLRIRSEERLGDTPVIMLSSLDEVDSVVRCIELGAEEYLVKPVPTPVLEARVAANVELGTIRALGRRYHDRLEADESFIESLLTRTFPARFRERVRAGDLDVEERYPATTALCCAFGKGTAAPSAIRRVYHVVEAAAEDLGIGMSLWRPGRFVALAGAPGDDGDHGAMIADLALAVAERLAPSSAELPFRIGLHTGPASGGILGKDRFRFDLWGEAVELSEAVAACAPWSGIVVTPSTHGPLQEVFVFQARGIVEVAGRGRMRLYELSRRAESGDPPALPQD